MSKQTPPTPAPAPKGPSLIEYIVIVILAVIIVAAILVLVGPLF